MVLICILFSYPEEAEVDVGAEVTADAIEERLVADDEEDEVYVESRPALKTEEAK